MGGPVLGPDSLPRTFWLTLENRPQTQCVENTLFGGLLSPKGVGEGRFQQLPLTKSSVNLK
eukprot:4444593-Amphidinium_carterae.1